VTVTVAPAGQADTTAAAVSLAAASTTTVDVTWTGQADATAIAADATVVAADAAVVASDAAVVAAAFPAPTLTPATAAAISAGVASSTRRFRVKIQPSASLGVSHVLPAAVGSPICRG